MPAQYVVHMYQWGSLIAHQSSLVTVEVFNSLLTRHTRTYTCKLGNMVVVVVLMLY